VARIDSMMKNRWLAKSLAKVFGYFWLPCPNCGREFGGFECGDTVVGYTEDGFMFRYNSKRDPWPDHRDHTWCCCRGCDDAPKVPK